MKHKRSMLALSVIGATATLLPLLGVAQAGADYAPQPGDVVGVGGDTPQFSIDFALNGDTLGDSGFNSTATVNRVVDFDATADGNARSAYAQNSTETSPIPLNPTDVLRAGTSPVQRVSSSGNGISALLADTGPTGYVDKINFIYSASEPTAANQTKAASNGWGFLHVVQIGTDSVQIAADTTTNAPAGLSGAELVGIYKGTYTTWNQLPDNSGGSSATIIPEIPPSTSSIYKTFVAALKADNGGTTVALGSDVQTVEQNDPTAITGASSPANAIVPFSQARLNLWNSGYFYDPTIAFPGATSPLVPGVKLLSGTTPDAGAAYSSPITDYVIFRQSDLSSTTPLEPGGTLNWAKALFSDSGGPTPFFATSSTGALLTASGITPAYNDLGDVSSG